MIVVEDLPFDGQWDGFTVYMYRIGTLIRLE
jgi:hypothetical protein